MLKPTRMHVHGITTASKFLDNWSASVWRVVAEARSAALLLVLQGLINMSHHFIRSIYYDKVINRRSECDIDEVLQTDAQFAAFRRCDSLTRVTNCCCLEY